MSRQRTGFNLTYNEERDTLLCWFIQRRRTRPNPIHQGRRPTEPRTNKYDILSSLSPVLPYRRVPQDVGRKYCHLLSVLFVWKRGTCPNYTWCSYDPNRDETSVLDRPKKQRQKIPWCIKYLTHVTSSIR